MEHEITELKRELYDSKERELDLRDQMQYLETDCKNLQKRTRGLEQDNDNLNTQLKKMSTARALKHQDRVDTEPSSPTSETEAEVELKIQLDLADKELSTLKKNFTALDEENELLHKEMYVLETRVKEQEKQLHVLPEPSSPKAYYEDKLKGMAKEADELRSKMLEKDNELELLYAELHSYHSQGRRASKRRDLRKSRSLDSESEFHLVIDLRRQLELSKREVLALREKMKTLQDCVYKTVCKRCGASGSEEGRTETSSVWSGAQVPYVENQDEAELQTKLNLMGVSHRLLEQRIAILVSTIMSLSETHLPNIHQKYISKIAKISDELDCSTEADALVEPVDSGNESTRCSQSSVKNGSVVRALGTSSPAADGCQALALDFHSFTGKCNDSDTFNEQADVTKQTKVLSRDPDWLLSIIEQAFCELIERLCESDADSLHRNEVVLVGKQLHLLPQFGSSNPAMDNSQDSQGWETISESDLAEDLEEPERVNITCVSTSTCTSSAKSESIGDTILELTNNSSKSETGSASAYMDVNANDSSTLIADVTIADVKTDVMVKSRDDSESVDTHVTPETASDVTQTDDNDSMQVLRAKIPYLEEEIDDLRLIIKSKEEKNLLLEEEVGELETHVKKLQDESRRREVELIHEMDLIHGKNEILNNLLEIVQDRAESAEEELERVINEFNDAQGSPLSSDRSPPNQPVDGSPPNQQPVDSVSEGSDDVFEGSPQDKTQASAFWEDQFKKRIRCLENLLAEERKHVSSLKKKLTFSSSDVISSAMSDDVKLHIREKELLQSELRESQKHAIMANDQIRSLSDKLKKVDEKWRSPKTPRKNIQETTTSEDTGGDSQPTFCKTCDELQSVKDQLSEELIRFKTKAEELEIKIEEVNDIWVSKSAVSEREKQILEQKAQLRGQEIRKLEEQLNKLREEDRMKDIFIKERDNNLKDKTGQISRKEELIQEQDDIIRQREEETQALFDQISQREKSIKDLTESLRSRDERLKEKDVLMRQLSSSIDEKNDELHYMEEEMHDAVSKRKESESTIAELKEQIEESMKVEKTEIEMENERLNSDVENLMGNITELHGDKVTLENELDKAKQALSEAMLMWERDRSSLGSQLTISGEKLHLYEETARKKDTEQLQMLRREVHSIIETREKLAHELRLNKMEHDNTVRILKTEKFKLTEELTSKIRMLAHEMTNNDKMTDELTTLRGQDEINYQLHHHEKILRAEYMAMKVRYETQLERLQKEHIELLKLVEKLQREKNLDQEIIVGIQKGMSNIKNTYTLDLSRWKDERTVLTSHISQIEEGKEIAMHLRAQIDALKEQLADQDVERTDLVNKMTTERRNWDVEKAGKNSKINQLEEQMGVFIQAQSKCKDVQYRMEVAWGKERLEHTKLLEEAQHLTVSLQEQLIRRDEEHTRERKNLLEQLEKQRHQWQDEKRNGEKVTLELNTENTHIRHLERQLDELKEKQKKEETIWMRDKGELLRRLADMRKTHIRDRRRIDDVLTALKRLRELATIVVESDNSAMLPSNGNDVSGSHGDASAASASASVTSHGDENMADLKQNIDQVILKYVKESLRQIHFVADELAKLPSEPSPEERQTLRRSLSSSELELLKDEFLLGPHTDVTITDISRDHPGLYRQSTHDGSTINADNVDPDYIEKILTEQTSFYDDVNDTRTEVHRIKTTKDVTRVETKITSLPKPPPSFIIPRSRSTSPVSQTTTTRTKTIHKPVLKHITLDTTHTHRRSTPFSGVSSISSSNDSSPVGTFSSSSIPTASQHAQPGGLLGYGEPQSGSLDRLSPQTARKRFFEPQQPTSDSSSSSYMSWPERRKRETNQNRNSRNLTGSTEIYTQNGSEHVNGTAKLRNSVSMDDGVINIEPEPSLEDKGSRSRSADSAGKHHSSLRDMFSAMKKKLKPKVKRSQSAREYDKDPQRLQVVKEAEKLDSRRDSKSAENVRATSDDRHVTQEQLTPIKIPEDEKHEGVEEATDETKDAKAETDKKTKSRNPAKKSSSIKESFSGSTSTLQRIKRRFRSRSADRSRDQHDHHVKPILVGRATDATADDPSKQQYSETGV